MREQGQGPPTIEWSRRFGAHIEASRLRAGLTRAQLGARMGVAEETIRRWERGGTRPSEDRLVKLIAILAIDGSALRIEGHGVDDLPSLAKLLRAERADRRITQAEAAKLIGVAQPTYAGWEVGRSSPDSAHATRIAHFLGMAVRDVREITDEPFVVDSASWPALGRLIGERRQALRLTRTALAQRLAVSTSTIVNWELGYRIPPVQQLRALAAAIDVSPAAIEARLPERSGPMTALAEIVRARQALLGLSRSEIARRVGTDEATLSRWINGRRAPSDGALKRLAAVLELSVSSLAVATVNG